MNKQDWTVILVRGFGLYLLAHALFSIPSLFTAAYLLCANWDSLFPTSELSNLGDRLRTELITQSILAVGRTLLASGAGIYLLRSNSALRLPAS